MRSVCPIDRPIYKNEAKIGIYGNRALHHYHQYVVGGRRGEGRRKREQTAAVIDGDLLFCVFSSQYYSAGRSSSRYNDDGSLV